MRILIIIKIKKITSLHTELFTSESFSHPRASQSASDIITSGHWALNHSLNHLSSLWGEYSLCDNYMRYSAKSITRTISALAGTHLPLGGEKQL